MFTDISNVEFGGRFECAVSRSCVLGWHTDARLSWRGCVLGQHPWCQAATERMLKGEHPDWGTELSSHSPRQHCRKGVCGSGRKGAKCYKVLETVASCNHALCAMKLTENRELWIHIQPLLIALQPASKSRSSGNSEARCLMPRFRKLD